jgi:dihydrofolate synthase / folylpolyglutamate synthase
MMENLVDTASRLTDYSSVRNFLYGLRYHGAKYGLEPMVDFSRLLGNPEKDLVCVHVAGTNGKGSTCAMIEAIYRGHGLKTGLYSSPHLIRQGERIQVNREIMSEDEIVYYTKRMVKLLLESSNGTLENCPSFFEFMTAMGFLKFQEEAVDVAVIETGLGGRLDATNIIRPALSIITSISLDHTQILGNDIESIAMEKAGIIKPNVPVVLGLLPFPAEEAIRARAGQLGTPVFSIQQRWGEPLETYPETNLHGACQRINAATAVLAVETLSARYPLDPQRCRSALEHVDWPGRWEQLSLNEGRLLAILDSTHNEEGARMLRSNLEELQQEHLHKPVIVTGSLGEDRARAMMEVISDYADSIYLLQPNQARALKPEQLRNCIPSAYKGEVREGKVEDLFARGVCTIPVKPDQPVLVTGSIYLIGEISDVLKSKQRMDQQALQDVI